ncbi:hypothetical protein [Paenibacillus apii]|uniref:hypothetical protein n=1 Tax=Paenibacillus apii TaxID=1850370 RepID=UPI00143B7D87|nr:hypothetical protein [Paenibacillus apii]NJJ37803.1 hypothetical protein [Paenibacillus apii]
MVMPMYTGSDQPKGYFNISNSKSPNKNYLKPKEEKPISEKVLDKVFNRIDKKKGK